VISINDWKPALKRNKDPLARATLIRLRRII
jgi:hypothetical protein